MALSGTRSAGEGASSLAPPSVLSSSTLSSPEAAKGRPAGGLLASRSRHVQVPEVVKKIYASVQKSSGQVGGYGHAGPVYGEITAGSFQKIVNFLKSECGFDQDSSFVDIGAGLGKPNFHVAADPGVRLSYGIELEQLRWILSLKNLLPLLEKKLVDNVYMLQQDVTVLESLEPFTHVYMFDVGFPPNCLVSIANIFNMSSSAKSLVSFKAPRDIIGKYGFAVRLAGSITTRMCGSTETHKAYIYTSTINVHEHDEDDEDGNRVRRQQQPKISDAFRARTRGGTAMSEQAKRLKTTMPDSIDRGSKRRVTVDPQIQESLGTLRKSRSEYVSLLESHVSDYFNSDRPSRSARSRTRASLP